MSQRRNQKGNKKIFLDKWKGRQSRLWEKDSSVGRQGKNLLLKITQNTKIQQIQLNLKMTWRLQNWLPTSGKEEKTLQKRVKWQIHNLAAPKPSSNSSPQVRGREPKPGGSRSRGPLNTQTWRSAPGTWTHSTWYHGDWWGWTTETGGTLGKAEIPAAYGEQARSTGPPEIKAK